MDPAVMKLRVVVVEDDPVQLRLIRSHLAKVHEVGEVHCFTHPQDALAHLRAAGADLLLLDIGLPDCTGFDLLSQLSPCPPVVVVTGDPDHALEGYERGVVDLLVKPFTLERLLRSVRRAMAVLSAVPASAAPPSHALQDLLSMRSGRRTLRIPISTILHAESLGNHVKLRTHGSLLVVNSTMKAMEDQLPPEGFLRVHRCHIVARRIILDMGGDILFTTLGEVPVGLTYRKQVRQAVAEQGGGSGGVLRS
jgi:DNA-binding LytR/AlgR family response regulator